MEFGQDPEFLQSIRRHFVSLCGNYVALDAGGRWDGDERPYCYSGFVIEICGVWCFMTAGHVFKDIDGWRSQGKVQLLKCGLADYYSAEARVKEPTPFVYEDANPITVDKGGMDFGLIALRDYYRNNLQANGVRSLAVARWTGGSPPPFEFHALLGLADEDLEPRSRMGERGPQIGYMTTLSLVGVEALPAPPPDRVVSPIPRFAAVLRDGDRPGSVKGMSGGPILGISRSERGWDYACVAVQGSWDEGRRMIYGTPVSIVVETITRLLEEKAG
jgi:hypothetical protein